MTLQSDAMGIKMNTCHTVLQQISISLHKEEYGVFFSYSDLCRLIKWVKPMSNGKLKEQDLKRF